MIRFSILLMLIFAPAFFYGQDANPFMEDVNGRPFYMHTSYRAEGSPYLSDNYQQADITTTDGKVYTNIMVKLDLAENRLLYLGKDGAEMVTLMPVHKIQFSNYISERGAAGNTLFIGYPKALNQPGATVYQVLDSGKASLLKMVKITYRDEKKYANAGFTRTFSASEAFFALMPGDKLVKIDRNQESVANLFPDKKKEVTDFINTAHIQCKTVAGLQQVFAFYNGLK